MTDPVDQVRLHNLGVRLSAAERALLTQVAGFLQRSASDTVRLLIKGAAKELSIDVNADELRVPTGNTVPADSPKPGATP